MRLTEAHFNAGNGTTTKKQNTMAQKIKLKRGLKASLPTEGMTAGEPLVTTDRGTMYLSTDATTKLPVVPPIEDLGTLSVVDGAADLLIVHDADEAAGQKEKKITFGNFKAALNIPAASTDEMVALKSGGTSGYLFGENGTDGLLVMGEGLSWALNAEQNKAELSVDVIDGGTF